MKNIATLTLFVLLINTFCYGQNPYKYSKPKDLNDGWKTAHLGLQNVDTTKIYQLFEQIHNGKNKLHSVLLVKNDQIIIEEYFNDHSSNKQHDLRSATKSIRSILLGIAIDQGFIDSIDDPISKYLKNPVPTKNLDKRKDKITIRHLLTMSPGFDCNDWDKKSKGQEDKVYKKRDWLQYTLNLPMVNEPGTVSNYCSMGVVLLAEIISQASKMTIDKFSEQYLFNPLGITNIGWEHTSNKKVIPSGKRLYMTTRDMAKIGQLILNNGKWNDKQIVSKNWIEESTTPKTKITGIDYGYLWWNIPFKINEKVIISKTATGNGGQYIMIFPKLDMVAVFTGGAYNSQEDKLPFAIMQNIFLPTFINEK
ncbi:CubicO group peptidase (beta-lactamase class C family) [Aquimarina sp. MAR_2010_214]|uniref:serine hydrolase domain-containing protein n=1 Tax=Aquimarina sp. MAR_2010_214 TaxID=1250026 RepID=UPI000C708075|nr:serine hydrolase [Aquimarina sp. MAR_2010_214]PKV52841.1 CubicO group peptidase (beta-lactamase class C family) [Aquimarina sp. MAR_2010_214]